MTPTKSDELLLRDYRCGNAGALGELAQRYERALLGLASGLLGGRRDLACDAVQETWLRVIRFGDHFDGRSSFKTWLYRITLNQCRTLAAAGANRDAPRAVPDEEQPEPRPSGSGPPGAMSRSDSGATGPGRLTIAAPPEAALAAAERRDAVRQAVARLDAERRAIVLLCYHEGLTHEQAAEILEIPIGTLKSRLHAALTELRALLRAEAVA